MHVSFPLLVALVNPICVMLHLVFRDGEFFLQTEKLRDFSKSSRIHNYPLLRRILQILTNTNMTRKL